MMCKVGSAFKSGSQAGGLDMVVASGSNCPTHSGAFGPGPPLAKKPSPTRYVDPIREARHVVLRRDACRAQVSFERDGFARLHFAAADFERQVGCDHHQPGNDCREPQRPDNLHRLGSSRVGLGQQQPGQPGNVVAVHVAD